MPATALSAEESSERWDYKRTAERERCLPLDEIVPRSNRLAVVLTENDDEALVEYIAARPFWERVKADALGWDLRRRDAGELGFDTFHLAAIALDDEIPTPDQVEARWQSFDRPPTLADILAIDLVDDATHQGFEPSPQLAASLERLREIAARRREHRDQKHDEEIMAECRAS